MVIKRRHAIRRLFVAFGSSFLFARAGDRIAADEASSSVLTGTNDRLDTTGKAAMEKVTGIGGFFFRGKDPEALGRWYEQHLGITLTPTSYAAPVWEQEAGPTVFAPFPETTDYFGDSSKTWMINFRVGDLDKMVAQLQASGIEVKIDPQTYPNGRFARLHDPEGNPIELWQSIKPGA